MSADRGHSAARTLAAVAGAPIVAFLVCAAVIAYLPVGEPLAFGIGAHLIVPIWVALACLLPLARSGLRAWAICFAVVVPLALVVVLAPKG